MSETETIQLIKFDIDQYLRDGDATIAKRAEVEAVADKIHDEGYENIFLLGIGGTFDELDMVRYFMNKYSEVEVHLINAAEFNVLGHNRLKKNSVVITASASGDTKEIVEAATKISAEGIRVVAFTRPETPLGKVSSTVIAAPVATGRCDYTYMLFDVLMLRLLNRRGEFDGYQRFLDQTKNLYHDLVDIRIKFEDKANEVARAYAHEPYSIFVGSGALWGEVVLFSMCILEEMQWVRTRSVTSAEFFHGTLELVEPGVPVFLLKGEDECRALDNRVEAFCEKYTDKLVVIDTAEYAIDGLDPEFRPLISPFIATATMHERLSKHYETYTKHNLDYRRYYRQFSY
ncbi:SIS domain-containing protein [Collinsella tanakaei]|uniref:SIS domain-containing protein n=1 Tax=Collinsella tanakaei TaxID=626935 RepID=A0A3E4QTJ8_9ACTN|nr:SIS domain-containing protein [Collinsella tanakaei]RGL10510.1 SIS domain-containing protein [Collinsella tanakaei]